jgi:hypothetical protein
MALVLGAFQFFLHGPLIIKVLTRDIRSFIIFKQSKMTQLFSKS